MIGVSQNFDRARALVIEHQKASATWLARELPCGKEQALSLIAELEVAGVVGPKQYNAFREVLLDPDGLPHIGPGHNRPPSRATTATDDRLRLLIERIERLEEERRGIGDDIRDVFSEAKATGYDVKIMRKIIGLRKMPATDRREMEAILEIYKNAVGLD